MSRYAAMFERLGSEGAFGAFLMLGDPDPQTSANLLDAVVDEVRLSTDPLDNCVIGGGTMTLLSARAGVAYEFDITRIAR